MTLKRIVPIVTTNKLQAVKDFYLKHFPLKVAFDSPEYLGLKSSEQSEIGFMTSSGQEPEFSGGLTFGVEVDNVDEEHQRLCDNGPLTPIVPLTNNPWGDRSFILADPIGVAVYVYSAIAPADEYKQYVKE